MVDIHISAFPSELSIGGNLVIENCPVLKVFPDNCTIGGNLEIKETGIERIPDSVTVGGDIKLQ